MINTEDGAENGMQSDKSLPLKDSLRGAGYGTSRLDGESVKWLQSAKHGLLCFCATGSVYV